MKSSHMFFFPRYSAKFQEITGSDEITALEHKLEISQLLVKIFLSVIIWQSETWVSNCSWSAKPSTLEYVVEREI